MRTSERGAPDPDPTIILREDPLGDLYDIKLDNGPRRTLFDGELPPN